MLAHYLKKKKKTDMLPKITEFVEKLGPRTRHGSVWKKILTRSAGTFNDVILPH